MVRRETYWTTITDCNGAVEQELSYDAWGNLRDPNTWLRNWYNPALEEPMFDRGYTGHEHIPAFGLINMNGRCYDPMISSFLSVDAYVQSPDNSQNFNRYSYCLNNPLKYTDPSGWVIDRIWRFCGANFIFCGFVKAQKLCSQERFLPQQKTQSSSYSSDMFVVFDR